MKASLRAEMKARRDAAALNVDAAEKARANLAAVIAEQDPERVSGYLSIGSELDPMPALGQSGRSLCVPVVAGRARPLEFCVYASGDTLEEGAFGVRIPVVRRTVIPDFLVVPLLAFDRRGFRLGYGGGFYDRTLADLRARRPIFAVGLAYAVQECSEVPIDAFDAQLDAIVTERDVIRIFN